MSRPADGAGGGGAGGGAGLAADVGGAAVVVVGGQSLPVSRRHARELKDRLVRRARRESP